MRGLKQWRFLAAGAGLALVLGLAACGEATTTAAAAEGDQST